MREAGQACWARRLVVAWEGSGSAEALGQLEGCPACAEGWEAESGFTTKALQYSPGGLEPPFEGWKC